MNKSVFSFLLAITTLTFGQNINSDGFTKIPDSLSYKHNLYKYIDPSDSFNHWKVIKKNAPKVSLNEYEILYDSKNSKKINNSVKELTPKKGFFIECMPSYCFTFIIAYKPKGVNCYSSFEEFRSFIGYIDNLPEALLTIATYDLWYDENYFNAGSYKIEKDFIYLYLKKSTTCPYTLESIFVTLNRQTGEITTKNLGVYYRFEKDCTIS
ncbi:hypothetical protein [Elizabethkingia anophelis]|uniref:hypothetical protein n=1 Tax=Elizabethkingia anophelis TaxID=1117645 RepID=UPI00320B366A